MENYALVWMSAGNSYFKESIIKKILTYAEKNFSHTLIISPDEPAEHTFLALGYAENEAKRKARLNANLLKNRAQRIVESFENKKAFTIIEWRRDISLNQVYQDKLRYVKNLYKNNLSFRKDALATTKSVIKKGDAQKAVNYLLEEISFVLASPVIYSAQKVVYLYHKDWPVYEKLIEGKYDNTIRKELGFENIEWKKK